MARQSKTKERRSIPPGKNSRGPSLLFDLDGTLADSVYEHVIAWQAAFQKRKFDVEAWKIHRYIGISGKLLVRGVFRNARRVASDFEVEKLEELHKKPTKKCCMVFVCFPERANCSRRSRKSGFLGLSPAAAMRRQ